jgi:hypothetical protein
MPAENRREHVGGRVTAVFTIAVSCPKHSR